MALQRFYGFRRISAFQQYGILYNGRRALSDTQESVQNPQNQTEFDTRMLEFIACPLSKKALRYDAKTNELICDEIGVAYSINNGIPNLLPQDARKIQTE